MQDFVDRQIWIYAKTMPYWPHWYILLNRMKTDQDRELFSSMAKLIFETGYDHRLKNGKTYRYLNIGEYKYWSMDPTWETTDLINRAFIDGRTVYNDLRRNIHPKEQA